MTDKTKEIRCLRCDGRMSPGYLVDVTQGGAITGAWVSGSPVQRRTLGMKTGIELGGKTKYQVDGYRCNDCGRLELFAKEVNPHYQ